jgi:hypothetical protein
MRAEVRATAPPSVVSVDRVESTESADLWPIIPVFRTPTACCGAAAAYILRRIAYRAGAYAPGIDDRIFCELHTWQDGRSIDHVLHWFDRRHAMLGELGYRLKCRCVAMPLPALLTWIRQGVGYRGVVLASGGHEILEHAVGVTFDRLERSADEDLVKIDPWPGSARDRVEASGLELPQPDGDVAAVAFHWIGWA